LSSEKGSSASKGGMSNKSAKTNPVVQGIRADQYAKEKLGIRTTVAGPVTGASTSPTGFISTTSSNQMYGSEYQQARNEYLASQGLGTMQKNGSFITGVQTDKGLVFTSQAREAYEASKREPIPLSRQMYESQQLFTQVAGAIATGLSGMPSFFSAAYYASKKPYSKYVGEYMSGARKGVDNQTITSSKNQTNEYITTSAEMSADFNEAQKGDEKALKRIQALAKSGEAGSPNRKFLVSSAKTFLGSMESGGNF
jgi:hypothetical protein